MSAKSELRSMIAERKRLYSQQSLKEMSRHIVSRLENHDLFKAARLVLLYNSLPDEPDTHYILNKYESRKKFLLPVVVSRDALELRSFTAGEEMHAGAFGIDEPQGECFENYAAIDLAVIPGVAFDIAGNRLGRGRGYYDRLLVKLKAGGVHTLGMCFDFQKLDHIPTEDHDVAVDEVL